MGERTEGVHRNPISIASTTDLEREHRHARSALRRQIPQSKYISHYVVSSPGEARILSKQGVWDVLNYIRASGGRGVSAGEIWKMLSIPPSDVYSILKELSRYGYVFPIPREKVPRGERKKRYVYDGVTWKRYGIDDKIDRVLPGSGELKLLAEDLGGSLYRGLSQVHEDIKNNSKDLLPATDPNQFCPKCGLNHEAIEFFHAVTIAALVSWETTHLKDLLSHLGYLQ